MKIINMRLKNFMGIRDLELNFNKQDVSILGSNAAGKTTCFSAFMWLLFNKDGSNRSDFEIKTLGLDGEPEHGLEHSVEAILDFSEGNRLILKKVYQEKWTKKRGSATAEFTGHTTDYFVDGVPVQKKEYDARIAEIADEQIFRLLTDPRYFNEQLHWQKRRELLLDICGDVSDAEVVSSNTELSKLGEILGNRTIEQHRKVIAARRTEINKELNKIPVRIEEVDRGLPDISNMRNRSVLESDIAETRLLIQAKHEELAQIKAGGQMAEKNKQLRTIEGQMLELKNKLTGEASERADKKRVDLYKVKDTLSKLKSDIEYRNLKIKSMSVEIGGLDNRIEQLRTDWRYENNKIFEFDQSDTCPTCGQKLPREQIQAARDKALSQFNKIKAEKLGNVNAEGKEIVKRRAEIEEELANEKAELDKLAAEIPNLEEYEAAIQTEIRSVQDGLKQKENAPEYLELSKQHKEVQDEIVKLQVDNSMAVATVQEEIFELNKVIKGHEGDIAKIDAHKNGLERINQLKAEERKLAAEYEELEHQVHLTEEFIRAKVHLLEKKINSKFKMARFKLFNTLVNGGVEECCETMYEGVPYTGNLNNGARLNVGIDIINTLADHYGFAPPVWLDNAESVTDILPTRGQQIRLIVSDKDKKLRIEFAEKKEMKEAV